ncbi:DUF1648 domain-containing protein [Microbacterium cremeum]|uniref:DUF1648 domain-containing protein n=1 Tax=Microbacterium cremeum TaxID=2782169 RepID=UPI001888598B|nr:DUF1648 domain-containing protein [Microbacterium cremeum]
MTRTDPVLRRFVLVAILLPLVFVAIGAAVQLALLPSAPATIAVHWNASGQADRFAPAWTQPIATIAFGFGIPVLLALTSLPGLRRGERGSTYRLVGAMAAATSALVTVAFTWTFAMQAALSSPADAPAVWGSLVGSFLAGALAGVAAWWLQPRQDTPGQTAAPAAPLDLGPTERALWVRTAAMSTAAATVLLIAAAGIAAAAVAAWVTGAGGGAAWILSAVAVLLLALVATTVAFHVRVDDTGLHVASLLGIPRFGVPLADTASAACVVVDPMGEFGGWGLRIAPHGRRFGVVLRRGEAIEVTRRDGRRFVVTVDDARTGAALLEALIVRGRARS